MQEWWGEGGSGLGGGSRGYAGAAGGDPGVGVRTDTASVVLVPTRKSEQTGKPAPLPTDVPSSERRRRWGGVERGAIVKVPVPD